MFGVSVSALRTEDRRISLTKTSPAHELEPGRPAVCGKGKPKVSCGSREEAEARR